MASSRSVTVYEPDEDPSLYRRIRKAEFPYRLAIESYGVRIGINANSADAIREISDDLPATLADRCRMIGDEATEHDFYYRWNPSKQDSLYKDDRKVLTRLRRADMLDQLRSRIRLTVAEYAVGKAFVHAGVVGWRGKAIVIPASSFRGKSTLTAELVRRGAEYYSDEYAVFEKDGRVSPFPKMLSIRGDDKFRTQTDHPVESFGGKAGTKAIPVGMILITQYKENAKWRPTRLTSGQGVIELIKNSLAIRYDPEFNLPVFHLVTKDAVIYRTSRTDVSRSAGQILELFDSHYS